MKKKHALKFRPKGYPAKFIMQDRRRGIANLYRSTQARIVSPFDAPNKRVLGKIFSNLHYLAIAAPEKVNMRYYRAYWNFYKAHFGDGNQSANYANTWTCHRWM